MASKIDEKVVPTAIPKNTRQFDDKIMILLLFVKRSTDSKHYKKQYRKKTLDIANKFNACILSDSEVEMILEMSGNKKEISRFISKLRPFGIIEITRSGLVSMASGVDYIKK